MDLTGGKEMQKNIFVLLITFLLFICLIETAQTKDQIIFGDWDQWEKTLPPWDHEGWRLKGEKDIGNSTVVDINSTPIFVNTRIRFFKSENESAIVILFSEYLKSEEITLKDVFKIADNWFLVPKFALAIFPLNNNFLIAGYQSTEEGLCFLEKWELSLKANKVIINKKTTFYKMIVNWMVNMIEKKDEGLIIILENTFPKEKYDALLPQIIRDSRGYGFIPRKKINEWKVN